MVFTRRFFRAAAICSFVSVATTLGLILLPNVIPPARDLAERMAAHGHPAYVIRSWVYFCHPFVVLAAALGVMVRSITRSPGTLTLGFVCFMLWAFLEAAQQGLTLVAFDRLWRPAFLSGGGAARESVAAQVAIYDALWDSLFFVLVVGYAVGSVLYGFVLLRGNGLERVIGALYLLIAAWSFHGTAVDWGAPRLPALLDAWLYPVVQPVARTLIGVWLWRAPPLDLSPAPRQDRR
jgi:hypothetical protein